MAASRRSYVDSVSPDESTADILASYSRARSAADRVINEVELEEIGITTACHARGTGLSLIR